MNKLAKLVLNALKPKVKALGFRKDEVEGIAADIANNLNLEEESSEEEVNAEIEKQIDAVIPYLKIAQKTAQRTIQNFKEKNDNGGEEDEDESVGIKKENDGEGEEIPSWAQAILTQQKALQADIVGLKADHENDKRRQKLTSLLKDTGAFGKSTMKGFKMMKFANDSEFEEYYDGIVEDLAAINQERANEGLGKLGKPIQNKEKNEDKIDLLNADEIDALAETM